MSVTISVHPFLRHHTGGEESFDVEGSTVEECLRSLCRRFPGLWKSILDAQGNLMKPIEVFVNGISYYPSTLGKVVNDGDELYIVMYVAGG